MQQQKQLQIKVNRKWANDGDFLGKKSGQSSLEPNFRKINFGNASFVRISSSGSFFENLTSKKTTKSKFMQLYTSITQKKNKQTRIHFAWGSTVQTKIYL